MREPDMEVVDAREKAINDMLALDDWDRRRALGRLLSGYYVCLEGTRLIIDGESSDLYFVSKSEFAPCENCHEEFAPVGQEFCEYCDDREDD